MMAGISELQAPSVDPVKLHRQRFWLAIRNFVVGLILTIILALNVGLLVMVNVQQHVNAKARDDQLLQIKNQLNYIHKQAEQERLAFAQYQACTTHHAVDHTPPNDCVLPSN